ncbi:hypothetical protein CR513_30548, partial [Mucuna pruriens]
MWSRKRLRIERLKVVRGDRFARHCTLVDLILSILAIDNEPSPFFHGDRCGRQNPLNSHPSETESSLTLTHLKSSQSNSIASNSALSRDHVGFISAETESDQSLLRAIYLMHVKMTKYELITPRRDNKRSRQASQGCSRHQRLASGWSIDPPPGKIIKD